MQGNDNDITHQLYFYFNNSCYPSHLFPRVRSIIFEVRGAIRSPQNILKSDGMRTHIHIYICMYRSPTCTTLNPIMETRLHLLIEPNAQMNVKHVKYGLKVHPHKCHAMPNTRRGGKKKTRNYWVVQSIMSFK